MEQEFWFWRRWRFVLVWRRNWHRFRRRFAMHGRWFLHYWGLGDGCGCRGRLIMDWRWNMRWRRR
jgi:hypothetical protein